MRFLRRLTQRRGDGQSPSAVGTWPPQDASAETDTDAFSPRAAFADTGVGLPSVWHVGSAGPRLPVWAFPVDDGAALDWWRRLRAVHPRTGWWPVLLGVVEDWLFEEWADPDMDGDAEVTRGRALDVDARLVEVVSAFPSWDGEPPRGGYQDVAPTTHDDVRLAAGAGLVGLVHAASGYQVPGLVGWMGAANHRLAGADHVAVLERWHDLWGAELIGLAHHELEVVVARPPRDEPDVMAVALEQYRYCPDTVEDDGAIEVFAARQVRGHAWYFWWD